MEYDVIIIGGGASALFLASSLKVNKGLILESTDSAGTKLLMSGGGSCNITNNIDIKEFPKMYGTNGKRIRTMLYKYNNKMLMKYMEELDVPLIIREDGKVFPKSMRAKDVLEALLKKANKNGFELITDSKVIDMNEGKVVTSHDKYFTKNIVIATGGKSYKNTGSNGEFLDILRNKNIGIIDEKPGLTPIYIENYMYKKNSGISFENISVTIDKHNTTGDVLLTHRGFSGPAILRLSQYALPGGKFIISYIDGEVSDSHNKGVSKSLVNHLADLYGLPKSFIMETAEYLNIDGSQKVSSLPLREYKKIIGYLKNAEYLISGVGGFNNAMVTVGGISLDEMDLKTLKLRKYNNIYAIGEVLDINGDTGGYNLQFCYSSAMVAANSIDKSMTI
jgi:hypothetical protein